MVVSSLVSFPSESEESLAVGKPDEIIEAVTVTDAPVIVPDVMVGVSIAIPADNVPLNFADPSEPK